MGDVVHPGRDPQRDQRGVDNSVADEKRFTDKQLDILHDHYKETFTRIREGVSSRDRLFLWIIGLFALLSLEIGYPAAIGGTLGKLSIAGGEINLQALPLPALLNITWVLTLVMGLRYCQTVVWVDRQYPYLHLLEEVLSPELGGGKLYQREGKVYLSEYPLLLDVAWFAYGILFPLILMVATVGLIMWEISRVEYPLLHILLDTLIAYAIITVFILYRVQPAIASWLQKRRAHPRRSP